MDPSSEEVSQRRSKSMKLARRFGWLLAYSLAGVSFKPQLADLRDSGPGAARSSDAGKPKGVTAKSPISKCAAQLVLIKSG